VLQTRRALISDKIQRKSLAFRGVRRRQTEELEIGFVSTSLIPVQLLFPSTFFFFSSALTFDQSPTPPSAQPPPSQLLPDPFVSFALPRLCACSIWDRDSKVFSSEL